MEADNGLKVKTVDDINFDQYQETESDDQAIVHKKVAAIRKSHFSRGNSSVFDSEDDHPTDKENHGARHNGFPEDASSHPKLR